MSIKILIFFGHEQKDFDPFFHEPKDLDLLKGGYVDLSRLTFPSLPPL